MKNMAKCLKQPYKEQLPWWCMVELGRKFIFLLFLIPFPQNTVSYAYEYVVLRLDILNFILVPTHVYLDDNIYHICLQASLQRYVCEYY